MANWLTPRRRAWLFSGTGVLMILGVIAAANVLSQFAFLRFDFSSGRSYSISRGSQDILSRLKDNLIVKVYFTPRLPPPYGLQEQYLKDLLGEYKSAARGRLKLEFINPEGNEERRRQAREAGITAVQLNVMARDKFEIKEAFMGAVFLYGGRTEVIGVLEGTSDLEYQITRRIKKLSAPQEKTVGFVTGHGEKTPNDPELRRIFEPVREQVGVADVALDKPLDQNLSALWIIAPTQKYKPAELERLKEWTASGKTLGLFLGRRNVNFQSFTAMRQETGLESLLKSWGVELKDGLVIDAQSEKVQMETQYGMFVAMRIQEYPFIPIATRFNPDHPASRNLDAVTLPFVNPIKATGAGSSRYTSLVDSSPNSWYEDSLMVSPGQDLGKLDAKEKGPFSLAGVIEVNLSSAAPGRIVLVGSAYALDGRLGHKASNIAFFLNLLEWSCQDEALLSIRAKGLKFRPLRRLSDHQRLLVKYGLILFLPVILLATGLFSLQRQKKIRRALPQLYADV